LGVKSQHLVALFVGGEWDRKGLGLVIDAVAKARSGAVDAVLWVVGPGDEERFAAMARELGLADAIRFFGLRVDTERFYQAADVFVLPSAYETFSLACFEAAACGLPLVVAPVHGAGELVGDDEAGILVARDAASIAAALTVLGCAPDVRAERGALARARAQAFTWERSAEAVAGLYRSLLAGAGR
jgi:UDP-glucose:(heptosyl)LPS alpha-1,3-glucosyltransferase